MKTMTEKSSAQMRKPKYLPTIHIAAAAGIIGVVASVRKAVIIYSVTEQIGRNIDTIRLISQVAAAIATLILTLMLMRMVDVQTVDDAEGRVTRLRRQNFTALIAAPMIDVLTLIGGSELIQIPIQAGIQPDSQLAKACTAMGVIDAFMAHAVMAALVLCYINFRGILRGNGELSEWSTALRIVIVGAAAVQIIVALLFICAGNAMTGSEARPGAAVAFSVIHSLAFAVLMVIFVRHWQMLAAECKALVTDKQSDDQSDTTN